MGIASLIGETDVLHLNSSQLINEPKRTHS